MLLKRDLLYREDDLKKEYVDAIKMFIGEENYEELILYHNVLYQL